MASLQKQLFALVIFLILFEGDLSKKCSKKNLILLHGIFRHGNKTLEGTYPTDPYKNETYQPFGKSQLTNGGRLMGFQTGRYLHNTYPNLFDFHPHEALGAYASPASRCKVYLQFILGGIFQKKSLWDPVPFDEDCQLSSDLFFKYSACPNFLKAYGNQKKSEEYSEVSAPYRETLKYLEDKSGLKSSDFVYGTAIFLYGSFTSQEEWGLELPTWSKEFWPDTIVKMAALEWGQIFARNETKILGAGYIMSKIINDTYNKLKNPTSKKLYLYVGHELNIYATLAWLGLPHHTIVKYGSYLLFQIHKSDNDHYIKIFYQNGNVTTSPKPVTIPNCGQCCRFDEFVQLYSAFLDVEGMCK